MSSRALAMRSVHVVTNFGLPSRTWADDNTYAMRTKAEQSGHVESMNPDITCIIMDIINKLLSEPHTLTCTSDLTLYTHNYMPLLVYNCDSYC